MNGVQLDFVSKCADMTGKVVALALKKPAIAPPGRKQRDYRRRGRQERRQSTNQFVFLGFPTQHQPQPQPQRRRRRRRRSQMSAWCVSEADRTRDFCPLYLFQMHMHVSPGQRIQTTDITHALSLITAQGQGYFGL